MMGRVPSIGINEQANRGVFPVNALGENAIVHFVPVGVLQSLGDQDQGQSFDHSVQNSTSMGSTWVSIL